MVSNTVVLGTLLLSCVLLSSITPSAYAGTLLTNGQPLHVDLPPGVSIDSQLDRTVINGDEGFTIFVPPGATQLRVDFQTTPGEKFVELLVQGDRDVGTEPAFRDRADFLADPNDNGLATIVIGTGGVQPPIHAAIYYIGFRLRDIGMRHKGTITATVGGAAIPPEIRVQESQFISDLEGWTRNATSSPYPGTNVGSGSTTLIFDDEGGNPNGFARLRHTDGFGPTEWFVAPDNFLMDFTSLDGPRFQFDLARVFGDSDPNFKVQMRVYGDNGAYQWTGLDPPETGTGWQTFSVTMDPQFWILIAGDASFEEVFSDPKRIEVRANYVVFSGTTGLDNFQVRARGGAPPISVLPTVMGFAAGLDGWGRNYPKIGVHEFASEGNQNSAILWVNFEGNPGGYARLVDNGGNAVDRFRLPDAFLGDMSTLDEPRFEFDYLHLSPSAKGGSSPVRIRLVGRAAVYEWTGVTPDELWAHQIAPITAAGWSLVGGEGTFEDVLSDVVGVEVSADHAVGSEANGIDNFALLTADSPLLPATITASPSSLEFSSFVTGGNPEPQIVRISSSGRTLAWDASTSGALAERISVTVDSGPTPALIFVIVDSQGLDAGNYAGTLTITPTGTNIPASEVAVQLHVGPQPTPTPLINDDGIVDPATYSTWFSPGSLGSIFGVRLGGPEGGLNAIFGGRRGDQLPAFLEGVKVLALDQFGNVLAECPLLYVSDKQINFQLPFEIFGYSGVWIAVESSGVRSEPHFIPVQSASPAVFKMPSGFAAAQNQSGSLNSTASPLPLGHALIVYFIGQGVVAPDWASGRAAPAFPPIRAPSAITVTIGGVPARIQFIGLAPGMVGVGQANIFPGDGTPSGTQPLVITINGLSSPPVNVSIQ
ncbi:MAG: hypothetical protein O2968_15085 [Acidobacteria bacterium]|nr:hypothetical protein [Acidobacteriota bacterium]